MPGVELSCPPPAGASVIHLDQEQVNPERWRAVLTFEATVCLYLLPTTLPLPDTSLSLEAEEAGFQIQEHPEEAVLRNSYTCENKLQTASRVLFHAS